MTCPSHGAAGRHLVALYLIPSPQRGSAPSPGRLTRWGGALLLVMVCLFGGAGCRAPAAQPLQRFEFTEPQMGAPFRMVLYATSQAQAEVAAQAAFARIAELNGVMSDYDSDSELSRLSLTGGSGQAVKVSEDLWKVLSRAQDLAHRTDGAFDVTVGPEVILWRKARRDQALPDPARLARARGATGWRHLGLDPRTRTARLQVSGMRLDLGAIAKGYAVDEAMEVLAARRIRSALVAGGGDLAVSDSPPGRPGWRIDVPGSEASNAPPAQSVLLRRAALATSGDLFQHVVIDGVRYSHIVDPRTGLGLTDQSLVTVIARDCMTADSLSTAISVLGPKAGLPLARSEGVAVRVVRLAGGRVEFSEDSRFRRALVR